MTVWQDGSLQACCSATIDCTKQTAPDETSIRRRTAFMKLPMLMSYDIMAAGNTYNGIILQATGGSWGYGIEGEQHHGFFKADMEKQ